MNVAPTAILPVAGAAPTAAGHATAPHVVMDLSRLLSRVLHPTPTGIDRVEMAFASELLLQAPDRLRFAALHPAGWSGPLNTAGVKHFLSATQARWRDVGDDGQSVERWMRAALALTQLAPRPFQSRRRANAPSVYFHLSPRALEQRHLLDQAVRRERAKLIVMLHDVIPLSYPEYARPRGTEKLLAKLQAALSLADGLLVNSHATHDALQPYLERWNKRPPVHRVPLAPFAARPPVEITHLSRSKERQRPYFLMVATIEPRKNHLLLLHLWRDLVGEFGPNDTPRLILVGRRGWENENVLDLLDRCDALHGVVEERARVSDAEMTRLLRDARALLMPSFAEGYGLPIVEALAAHTPVIASNLPAHREAGGGAPEFLDPLDGAAWRRAILDYAAPRSARRAAQQERLRRFEPPTWAKAVSSALDFAAEISR